MTITEAWQARSIGFFSLLCAIVSFRPRLTFLGLAVFIGPPAGSFSWPQAGCAVALLLLGPTVVTTFNALPGAAFKLWRDDSTALGRAATADVIRPWARRFVIASVLTISIVEGSWFLGTMIEVCAVFVPLLAYRRSYHRTAIATGSAASAITGWSIAPLALIGVSFGLEAFRLATARLPRQWHPLPRPSLWQHPMQTIRCIACDRRIAQSDILGARHEMGFGNGQWMRFRFAFLDLEEHLYQSALSFAMCGDLDVRLVLPTRVLLARALSGTAQYAKARDIYLEVLSTIRRDGRFRDYVSLLLSENDLAAGHTDSAVHAASRLAKRSDKTCDYFMHQRALRVLIEYQLSYGSKKEAHRLARLAADDLLRNRAVGRLALASEQSELIRRAYGSKGSLYMHVLRADILSRATEPAQKSADQRDSIDSWDPEPVAMAMAVSKSADDLVEVFLTEAQNAHALDQHEHALSLISRGLMELDRTRYRLAAQSSRTSWSRRFRRVLDVALAIAHDANDHEFLAELLEFARIQTLPATTAEESEDIVLSTPPVVLVNGRTRLARPGEAHRPSHVSLERAAEKSAGIGAWWLSYWESEGLLYWALVDPLGKVTSGKLGLDSNSALRSVLSELERALPALLPGEHPAEADFRLARSPFLIDPDRERKLSADLGALLLPRRLIEAALQRRARGFGRLPLAIAPVAALGYVPWSVLAADGSCADPDRLIDLCDWVLAPSAALICNAEPREQSPAPLRLAIVDTTDDSHLGELAGARAQAAALPSGVRVLGGYHWTSDVATLPRFEQALRTSGPDSTVAFMCHAVRGDTDEPSKGGLVLARTQLGAATTPVASTGVDTGSQDYDVLSPRRILMMNRNGLAMPAQVILQACDTSALKDAASGEWLTIAPAFIATGAREVIATVYPLPDVTGSDDPLIRAALKGGSLQVAVSDLQREGLMRWNAHRATKASQTPFIWGAYAAIAVRSSPRKNERSKSPRPTITDALVRILSSAIRECAGTRAKRLDSGYIFDSFLQDGDVATLLDGDSNKFQPMALAWREGPTFCNHLLRIRDRGPTTELVLDDFMIRVPFAVIDALRAGRAAAERDGLPLTPHHVIDALLGQPTAARRMLGLMARLTRHRRELVQRAIDFEFTKDISEHFPSRMTTPSTERYRKVVDTLLTRAFTNESGTDVS